MTIDKELEKEVLTRLLHAHPTGLGKEVLDNYRGEHAVVDTLEHLRQSHLIHDGCVTAEGKSGRSVNYPIKLSSAGVEAAKRYDA